MPHNKETLLQQLAGAWRPACRVNPLGPRLELCLAASNCKPTEGTSTVVCKGMQSPALPKPTSLPVGCHPTSLSQLQLHHTAG
jgi:hypothetical protein